MMAKFKKKWWMTDLKIETSIIDGVYSPLLCYKVRPIYKYWLRLKEKIFNLRSVNLSSLRISVIDKVSKRAGRIHSKVKGLR